MKLILEITLFRSLDRGWFTADKFKRIVARLLPDQASGVWGLHMPVCL